MYSPANATILLEGSICIQWNVSTVPNKFANNKDFDAAYFAAVAEPDDKKREQLYWKAEQILHDDAQNLWLVDTPGVFAYRSDRIKQMSFTTNPYYFDSIILA